MYSASQTVVAGLEVVQLADRERNVRVSIVPSIGNIAYEFAINGKNALWFPFANPSELKASPRLCGVPFLAPWANRIDGNAYWVNGHRYALNLQLGNLRLDSNRRPIHGLLLFSPLWKLVSAEADRDSAFATSLLEFWRYPELMAQFPFAHEISMTHRLANGSLEVETTLINHANEPMPVGIGFHPYFQLHDAHRNEWNVHLSAREHVELDEFLIPTGTRRPVDFDDPHPLGVRQLDDVFTNLIRGADERASFWVAGKHQKITVSYGLNYKVAVIYAPQGRDFICFEPMAALTNAFNLAHQHIYEDLQTIGPGGHWRENFFITPEGF
jgi:aldose 1-epimerase